MYSTDNEFVFALRPHKNGPPPAIRVRRFLKEIGRRHGLRVMFPKPAPREEHADYGRRRT